MEKLKPSELKAGRLDRPVFHSSGEVLLDPGRPVTSETVRLLEQAGIEEIFRPAPGEDPGEFVHTAANLVMSVSDLKVGQRMTKPIFDGSGALLTEAGTVVTERMASGLRRRGVDRIYVRKGTAELKLDQVQAFRRMLRRGAAARPAPVEEQVDARRIIPAESCTSRAIDELLDSGGEVVVPSGKDALVGKLKAHGPLEDRAVVAKDGFVVMYEEALAHTSGIFNSLGNNQEVDPEQIGETARQVVGGLVEDRDLLLNLTNIKTGHDYLMSHSLGVSLLTIAVATSRGWDRKLVLEMGYAAYLHDVGMLRVPVEIVAKPGKLSAAEVLQVRRHPIHSLDVLQQLVGRRSGLASTIPMVAYQSHERENGSGYPKGRKSRVIHDFAKVLAVCDVYQALTCRRPWREAMLPYLAMEQIVLMGSRRELDLDSIRALLRYTSLFPIGSWVELSDGSTGRVVAANEDKFTRPAVCVMFRGGQRLPRNERVNLLEQTGLGIVRPIPPPEEAVDVMDGF